MAPEKTDDPSKEQDPADENTPIGEFYSDIADILSNLGEGIASAQTKLDIGAMEAQKEILEDESLTGYGLSANWYVMPEAEFRMAMELGISLKEKVEGETEGGHVTTAGTKVVAALANAKYEGLYESKSRQESSLRIRFVPVPMPSVVMIPNVVGMKTSAAKAELALAGVRVRLIDEKNGETWISGTKGKVTAQSVPGGGVMVADRTLIVKVKGRNVADIPEDK